MTAFLNALVYAVPPVVVGLLFDYATAATFIWWQLALLFGGPWAGLLIAMRTREGRLMNELTGELGDAREVYGRVVVADTCLDVDGQHFSLRTPDDLQGALFVDEIHDGRIAFLVKATADDTSGTMITQLEADDARELAAVFNRAAEYAERQEGEP